MRLEELQAELDAVAAPGKARGMGKRALYLLRRVWIGAGILFTIVFLAFNLVGYRATEEARAALVSDAAVEVTETPVSIVFTPPGAVRETALLFYAGALVQPAAYAPLLRRVAEAGHLAVLLPLPARSAPTERHVREAIGRGFGVMEDRPELQWIVGGHSKGGAIAAQLVAGDPRAAAGLLLVGTSHPRELDLSALTIPVLKVLASRDGLASPDELARFASNLPPSTEFVTIEGGNHAQFGYYRFQFGDRRATISREEQQDQLFAAIMRMLSRGE